MLSGKEKSSPSKFSIILSTSKFLFTKRQAQKKKLYPQDVRQSTNLKCIILYDPIEGNQIAIDSIHFPISEHMQNTSTKRYIVLKGQNAPNKIFFGSRVNIMVLRQILKCCAQNFETMSTTFVTFHKFSFPSLRKIIEIAKHKMMHFAWVDY